MINSLRTRSRSRTRDNNLSKPKQIKFEVKKPSKDEVEAKNQILEYLKKLIDEINLTQIKEVNTILCRKCTRPFEVIGSEKEWKTLCISCHFLSKDYVYNCESCDKKFLGSPTNNKNCYDCTLGINGGVKEKCKACSKVFYYNENGSIKKTHCYECYWMENGLKRKCKSCKKAIYIDTKAVSWKNRCLECYLHNK